MYNALQHASFLLLVQATASRASYHGSPTNRPIYQLARGGYPAVIQYFYLSFAILSLTKFLGYLLDKRTPDSDFPRRKPFLQLISCAAISLCTAYAIGFAEEQKDKVITMPTLDKSVFAATAVLMRQFAHCFVYAGLLILLEWRLARPDSLNRPKVESPSSIDVAESLNRPKLESPSSIDVNETAAPLENLQTVPTGNFRMLSAILIVSMAASAIVRAVARAIMETDKQKLTYQSLSNLFVGIYVLATIQICFTSARLWKRRPRTSDEMLWVLRDFDDRVLKVILSILCPLIVIRAMYEVAWEVIVFKDPTDNFNWTVLNLVDIIVAGLTYSALLARTLWLGRPFRMVVRR